MVTEVGAGEWEWSSDETYSYSDWASTPSSSDECAYVSGSSNGWLSGSCGSGRDCLCEEGQ